MPSTLHSLYTAQRGLSLNQAAIDVINSNISNINTKGYSKQRLEISQDTNLSPYQNPLDAAQDGLGAVIDLVSRNRDVFLDYSLRRETTEFNYYKEYAANSVQLENTINELGDSGIGKMLSDFYNGLSQLASNPNDFVVRSTVVQNAVVLAQKFNSTYNELQTQRTDLVGDFAVPATLEQSKLNVNLQDLNDKLAAVADLNNKINLATAEGITPNALLDERDIILDQISEYIPANIIYESNNTTTIRLGSLELVRGASRTAYFDIQAGDASNPALVRVVNEGGSVFSQNAYNFISSGKIASILQIGGADSTKLTINGLMTSLNTLANEFAAAINAVQTNGRYIDNSSSPHELSNNTSNPADALLPLDTDPENFFVDSDSSGTITAGNIKLNDTILNNPYQIATASLTSALDETGDGANVLLMAQTRTQNVAGLGGINTQGYLTNLAGLLGTQSKSIQDNLDIKEIILQQVSQKREAVTGVNLDEELADLIRFQRSYEASAKIMSVISQTLDTIINIL